MAYFSAKQIQTRPCTDKTFHDATHRYPPLIQRILAARGIHHSDELNFALKQLHPISSLKNVKAAAQLLAEAISHQQKILIVGDYDADGATATALCIRALHLCGHQAVDFLVPDRFKYGYGLTPAIVELAQPYRPWLLMTVDNGVSSIEGVEAAQALGMKTLITDHHLPGQQLPASDVMVNPNQPHDDFPSKALAGVGVAFYVMLALKQELIAQGYFAKHSLPEPNLVSLLDLVALGTVADVVPLDANNRILVEQGLRRIRSGSAHAGIHALLTIAKKDPNRVVSSDFGFACGPRLNAAGRLADMGVGIRCLLTDDPKEATRLALQLDSLNHDRRQIEADMKEDAEHIMQALGFERQSKLPPIMCLHQADWHEGVVGILASRLKDRYHRPVIVFANSEGGWLKGSGRCIEGLHLRDLIDEVATQHPGMIQRFGGHAMAAGLTLAAEHFQQFQTSIIAAVNRQTQPDTFRETIYTDGGLTPSELSLATAEQLQALAPWGQWFPEPQFEGEFEIKRLQILKDLHVKATLLPIDAQAGYSLVSAVTALQFFADLDQWPTEGERVRIIYRLSVNEYRHERSLQLIVAYLLPNSAKAT
ncbi:single-stranded-DNA-specific exonuclease RecJ [Thiothrix eikelboomii]|uniref:single-stranded-DNA-specific exonuclease RecJ n=1 Tax=Thiothrix eikelboomii TaxID=92487 RepID=UPI003BB0A660